MSWRVVHFLNDDSVEAVPAIWIIKESKECFWPSIHGAKLKNLIAKCEKPCEDWETFPIRIIGSTYENLATARLKAVKAETTSDLNSDPEQKRIRKRNTLISSSGSDSEEDMNIFRQIPVLKQKSNQDVHPRTSMEHQQLVRESLSSEPLSQQIESVNLLADINLSQNTNPSHISDDICNDGRNIEINNPSTPKHKAASNLYYEENFKRQVLRQLNVLSIKLDQLSEDIANINLIKRGGEDPVMESVLDEFQLPLKTQEELNVFEDFLQNKENISKVVRELSIIGGSNYKVMVKRLMTRVLQDELAILYSWVGFKNKQNFSSLNLCSTLIESVQKSQKNCTNAEIENAMKLWLVKAKERSNKKT